MQQEKVIKKIVWVSLAIYLLVAIVLAIISFIDYSLVIGWLYGGFTSIVSWSIGILLLKLLLKKAKNRSSGFWLGLGRWIIQMIWLVSMFFVLIIVDDLANGFAVFDGGVKVLMSPINFFTYIAGVGLSGWGTLVAHIFIKKGE